MEYLESVLEDYRNSGLIRFIVLSNSVNEELDSKKPEVIAWKDANGLIHFSNEKEYSEFLKNYLSDKFYGDEFNKPDMIYCFNDIDLISRLYELLVSSSDYEEKISGVISLIKEDAYRLIM